MIEGHVFVPDMASIGVWPYRCQVCNSLAEEHGPTLEPHVQDVVDKQFRSQLHEPYWPLTAAPGPLTAPGKIGGPSKQDASIALKKLKARWDLCPMNAMDEVVDVLTFGSIKHEPDGWKRVQGGRTMYKAALMRHVSEAFQDFDAQDEEMQVSTWAAVAANALILLSYHLEDLDP